MYFQSLYNRQEEILPAIPVGSSRSIKEYTKLPPLSDTSRKRANLPLPV